MDQNMKAEIIRKTLTGIMAGLISLLIPKLLV